MICCKNRIIILGKIQRNLRIRQLCRLTNYEDYKRLSYKNNISVKDYKRKIANYWITNKNYNNSLIAY
jgi:hypothetical protein